MKKNFGLVTGMMLICMSLLPAAHGQSIDAERMQRDIKVAENVLATLVKHELGDQGRLFGFNVKGNYQEGYGVTFNLPADHGPIPFVVSVTEQALREAAIAIEAEGYRYSLDTDEDNDNENHDEESADEEKRGRKDRRNGAVAARETGRSRDSINNVYYEGLIRAAKSFIIDYGDMISQLKPNERIVVTNGGGRQHFYFPAGKRRHLSVEGKVSDITLVREGKLTRDRAMERIQVVNAETVEKKEPDLEMLSSIFGRLYRPDLSSTYFVEGNVYYDRLADFGAVFYMRVVSSVEREKDRYSMPTLKLQNLTKEERERKVTELYPRFEQEMKEHILEYGRTVKSLGDDESLVFNVRLTKCDGCGIPATLELAIKGKALKDFASGKISKEAALSRFTVKKGNPQ